MIAAEAGGGVAAGAGAIARWLLVELTGIVVERDVVLIVMLPMFIGLPPRPVYVMSTDWPPYSSLIPRSG